jgi:mono/diheme cytochrome c family protein
MKAILFCCVASATLLTGAAAYAADAEAGRRLAEQECAACHIVSAHGPFNVVADSPPFTAIARKYAPDWDGLAINLMGPHAKMNFGLRRPDALNIAAYIATLAK